MSKITSPSEDRKDAVYCCVDCDWRASLKEENSGDDYTKQLIQHHVETAHTVIRQSSIGQDTSHVTTDN